MSHLPIILIVVAVMIGVAILSHQQAKRRRLALAAWAHANGLTFTADRDRGMADRFPLFQALRQGDGRYAYNVMEGERHGRGVCCFDYHYETHSTDSKGRRQTNHHHFSAAVVRTALPLKKLFIRPEGFFDRVTEFFGFDDIDFESGAFSRAFYVKSPDKRWAYDVLHQETMEYMLEAPRFHLEMGGLWFMAWRSGRFSPEEFSQAVALMEGVLDRLPEYLLRELQEART